MNVFDQFDGQQNSPNVFDQFGRADPMIGQPQELTFAEKYLAPLLEAAGVGKIAGGNLRGSAVGGAMQGAADPGVAAFQLAANLVGQGSGVSKAVQAEEQQYQQARAEAGRGGVDAARLAGNVGMNALVGAAVPGMLQTASPLVRGVAAGGAFGALDPVTNGGENFATDKAKQIGIGAATGGATSLLGSLLARVVSPKASTNADLQLLRDEGVNPTIGQALGGMANSVEQKAMSIPVVGDAIGKARGRAVVDFNNAAINRATSPIGVQIPGAGSEAIANAGDALSNAYNSALAKVNHVNFDTPQFNAQLGQLQSMASGLTQPLAQKFDTTLSNVVLRKMSPNGSILGSDLKAVDSELGQIAARWGRSSVASEQEFGDAVKQLQATIRQEVARANPTYAAAQSAADQGWANLVRVENAGTRAVNTNGVFSPAQLNSAIRSADNSVRDRATARGTALMQDLGRAGQNVLANRVPNSGTTDRALLVASGAAAAESPGIMLPVALAGGALYSKPVQNALVALMASRPSTAPLVANYLRRLAVPATAATTPLLEQRFQR